MSSKSLNPSQFTGSKVKYTYLEQAARQCKPCGVLLALHAADTQLHYLLTYKCTSSDWQQMPQKQMLNGMPQAQAIIVVPCGCP